MSQSNERGKESARDAKIKKQRKAIPKSARDTNVTIL